MFRYSGPRLAAYGGGLMRPSLLSMRASPLPACFSPGSSKFLCMRRFQSGFANGGESFVDSEATGLHDELAHALEGEGNLTMDAALARTLEKVDLSTNTGRIQLVRLERPPGRFDILTNSLVYSWSTTAKYARKVTGPMREWSTELKYRTGVHMEVEPTHPDRVLLKPEEGGYATADDVELTVYLFGSERGIFNCRQLMESVLDLDPSYVRLGVFRRLPSSDGGKNLSKEGGPAEPVVVPGEVEWLMLRRINRDVRPPDIPPISLKLPGKWTLLYEQYKEAAVRTLWEETGITVEPSEVFPTSRLQQSDPFFYWRVPVHYFIAEVPYDVEVLGPQVSKGSYMHDWDSRLLRQSPDPVDRTWAQLANAETGCAWMRAPMIDELQRPLRGADYMSIRYSPPPYSGLTSLLGFPEVAVEGEGAKAEVGKSEEVEEKKEETAEKEPTPSA